jgi:hypothetical protein
MRAQRGRQRTRTRQGGASAVEFALVTSFLLLPLLAGIIQASFWMWAKQAGAAAAREGARALAVEPYCTDYQSFVKARVGPAAESWTGSGRVVSRTFSGPGITAGSLKVGDQVTLTLRFQARDVPGLPFPTPDINEIVTARVDNIPSSAGTC